MTDVRCTKMNKYDLANILLKILGISNCLGAIRVLGNLTIPLTHIFGTSPSQANFSDAIISVVVHIVFSLGIGIFLIAKSEYIVSRIFRIQNEKN